ncbi:MAG: competence/damage-inducible protein A [Geminocystis sp.]|nr:competence/damage-inducible protein A [Geminocystis sp.]HIK38394.1 competence/damage-inducible protein A [Geminocystis sp. M7585_C2015_104]MCS7147739.1 competence/damage-inducible protein A [Geminocystis sp.]MCX8079241.1 competence/damage-inducible protein A [Geminocystis sp.]MDW8116687.1 competence/damage-inducible protein A [Geminocystis sp.]
MTAEIICVGTELLLGNTLNSNAQYLAQQLANLGIPHYFQTVVGDNLERIHHVLKIALQRAEILIFTGGLGPTPDDLTTEAVASFFKIPLEEKREIIEEIAGKFAARGQKMPENNRKQALLPAGAQVIPNPTGTAPGFILQPYRDIVNHPQQKLTVITLPGVPSEMKIMWEETVIAFLESQGWGKEKIYSEMMRFRGIGESALATKVNHLFSLTNPTVAPYASPGEVKLRVSAKATSVEEARKIMNPVVEEIKAIAGEDYVGSDDDTLERVVGKLLQQRGETVSVAESCTGGGIGHMITSVPGSSAYFYGGIIAYSNEVKIRQLGVEAKAIEREGAVSETVAKQMAWGVKERLATDWGIGVTGIAGPGGGSESKPVGLVYVGVAKPDGETVAYEFRFGKNRSREIIRLLTCGEALDKLRRHLLKS